MSGNCEKIEEKEDYIPPEGEKSGKQGRPCVLTACLFDLVAVKVSSSGKESNFRGRPEGGS